MSPQPVSAYAAALGDDLDRLRPEVRAYFAGPPTSGLIGVGEGVFERVISRPRWLTVLARPVVGAELFLPRSGRDIPFRIENLPGRDADGTPALRARRSFCFPEGTAVFSDTVRPVAAGLIRDRLGARGRVEALLRCEVTPSGDLRMVSVSSALRLGRLRVPLPRLLGVSVAGLDSWDAASGRHLVHVRGSNPVLGTVIEYRGSFVYRYEEGAQHPRHQMPHPTR